MRRKEIINVTVTTIAYVNEKGTFYPTESRPLNRLPKIYTVDNDRETNRYAKFHVNSSIGASRQKWVKYNRFFVYTVSARHSERPLPTRSMRSKTFSF